MMRDEETLEWCRQQKSWAVWQEPWFRRKNPMHYAILKLLAKIGL